MVDSKQVKRKIDFMVLKRKEIKKLLLKNQQLRKKLKNNDKFELIDILFKNVH